MKKPVRSLALLSIAALAATGLASMSPSAVASTARAAEPEVLAKHLMGPLSAGVAKDGSVYVSQNFGGSLVHVVPGEDPGRRLPVEGEERGGRRGLGLQEDCHVHDHGQEQDGQADPRRR